METLDIISDLDDDLIDFILSRLLIRHAARTSLLSKRWRRKWGSIPNLVFDDNLLVSNTYFQGDFVRVVNKILLKHNGPILKFVLSTIKLVDSGDIDDWIAHLSNKGVRYFTLEIFSSVAYRVHSRLFSFENLTSLKLGNCVIAYIPIEFNGFNSLSKLELFRVVIGNDLFDRLISKCRGINYLKLHGVNRLDSVNVASLKLKTLIFHGSFVDFCFKYSTIMTLYIDFPELPKMNSSSYGRLTSLIKAPTWFSQIKSLAAAGKNFLKFLGRCHEQWMPLAINFTFNNLYSIIVLLPFQELDSIRCSFWILRISPKLKKFVVTATTDSSVDSESSTEFIKAEGKLISFLKLTCFKITGISEVKSEIEFIKLILDRSPRLETAIIEPNKNDLFYNGERMLKDLIRFRRASTSAEIVFT